MICLNRLVMPFLVVVCHMACAQSTNTTMQKKSPEVVTFIATFDVKMESKDGYYINGYVVDIDRKKAKKLNGRKIRITGTATVVEGLDKKPEQRDANGNVIVRQGRAEDTRHILNPTIEIVE